MAFLPRRRFPLLAAGRALLLGALLALAAAAASAKTVAVTFDDGFDTVGDPQAAASNASMLAALAQQDLSAMLFPAGKIADNPDSMALIRAWSAAGHTVGNHTYSHASLSRTDTQAFLDDVQHAQQLLQSLPGWCARLRFPYLDEGGDPSQHNTTMQWLAQHGYGAASATISLPDWEFATRYDALLQSGNAHEAAAFRQDYLQQWLAHAQAQESSWSAKLNRSPAHVLLLHTNHLNAAVLPDLLQQLQQNGWTFIEPAEAFLDPIYQRSYIPGDLTGNSPVPLPVPACQ